ncbi:DUF3971 domain-containing protein [Pseudooctadecabacter jejudonensis]|uniref:Uncharacterized protein n=1 Tax=Pseudooctadecabacter jejudonensis TaxID=1391910 RepID=A0A1Y5R949_9RHOB|nr:DUF3971 domain-containing protein [Pseudooctadecabacter jejudonensis]SLN12020.1 hypothetical protein PSJ8397_00130 [Pseudooctadecabacter jejudonensis]
MPDEDQTQGVREAAALAAAPRRSRGRRVYLWARAVVLVACAPLVMALIAAVLLVGREVTAPSWVVRDVETRAAEVLGGGTLDFGALTVTVGTDLHPRLVVRNAVLRDAEGGILAQVPRIEGLVSPRGVMQGRILAQEIIVSGAQVEVRRNTDGQIAFAFDQGAESVAQADGFLGLLDQIDQAFEGAALEALEEVRATGVIINYVDARAGQSFVVDNGRIGLDLRDDALALRADVAVLTGRSYVTRAGVSYDSLRGSRQAEIGFEVTDAAGTDIAAQAPVLSFLGVLDAPISGAVRGRLDADGALSSLSATLQIGAGEVRPTAATTPIPFRSGQTYLTFDPLEEKLTFDLIEVDSDLGRVAGTAEAYLRDYNEGWPASFLGHVDLTEVSIAANAVVPRPLEVSRARIDYRLRLDPFTLDVGEAAVAALDGETPVSLRLDGQVRAGSDGWSVALDAATQDIPTDTVLAFWPAGAALNLRKWLGDNVSAGALRDVQIAYRASAGGAPQFAMTSEFAQATVRFLRTLPPIEAGRGVMSVVDGRFVLSLDAGHVTPPEGGRIDMGGSTMVIPRTGRRAPAQFDLTLGGRLTAMMSLLRLPPFNVLADSDLQPSFAQGAAEVRVRLTTPLGQGVTPAERDWQATAQLRNLRSEVLVPGQVLTAARAEVRVGPDSLTVQGPARVGALAGQATFSRALGAGSAGTARLEADVTIGPEVLAQFNINLPRGMVTGEGPARLSLDLTEPTAPAFTLRSNLAGIGLSLPAVGWSKSRNAQGELVVSGQLGAQPRVDRLAVSAPGLETEGTIALSAGGGLERAAFERVRLGGWLDAPVVLRGRGPGRAAEIQIAGGSLDLRNAGFARGSGGGRGGGDTGGPLDIALDRLRITDTLFVDNFRGQFSPAGGLQGEFLGQMNGQAPINGTLVPSPDGAAVRLVSADAGAVLRATGLLRGALGGQLELTLIPTGAAGTYDGTLVARDLRVRDAPALASLLDAVSVVGLITQLDGQGLMFSDVDAAFRLTPEQVIVTQSSAVGPSIGLSLDGFYNQGAGQIDFQGVVSPLYLLNGIGAVFTRRGEGLIGFNFNLSGAVDSPRVSVNPLSALTPGMFREIFRRPPPQVGQ